ncbi:MAG: uroporphyrinogen decarboxylase family protein [Candidatus Humimicrobiaceae bacterium]
MNSIERVTAAMEFKPVDRPPIFPVITFMHASRITRHKVSQIVLNPELAYESLYAAWETYGLDGFEVPALDEFSVFREQLTGKKIDNILHLVNKADEPIYKFPDDDDLELPVHELEILLDDITTQKYLSTRELLAQGYMDGAYNLLKKVNGRAFLAGHVPGQTMNSLVKLRGSTNAIFDLMDSPDLVHNAMRHFTLKTIELGKAFADIGVNGIYIGDAWASASVLSPNLFEEFCMPYYKMATDEFHRLGLKVYLHICGNSSPILELMASTGVDAIEPLDPLGGVRLEDAIARVGNRVCLKGGINTLTLLNGTQEQVREEVRKCLELFGNSSGYIFGTGDDIPRDAPIENVLAMCDEVRRYFSLKY